MIKWNDVHVGVSPITNEIYIGKSKPVEGARPGTSMWIDKSEAKTEEVVKAVMDHMLGQCRDQKVEQLEFTIPGICKLQLTDLAAYEKRMKKEGNQNGAT